MKIIPTPKKVDIKEGFLSLSDIAVLKIADGTDRRVVKIAAKLKDEIAELCGEKMKLRLEPENCCCKCVGIRVSHGERGEGYTLSVGEKGIEIAGEGARGAYYAIQTLRQIIHEYGDTVPFVSIEDKPDFSERGFYHDVTRGKVPTLDMLKTIADTLAYYKISALQLYVEDAYSFAEYDGVMLPCEVLNADEIMALDDYCYENFIELVPSLATFGHLYNLLQSEKYKHLCELDNWQPCQVYWLEKMAHHTIDVSNPDSIKLIKSLIDQYIPLFRSDKFNICCDETFDLCRGKNAGKDPGEEYFKFLIQIINHVKSRGKTVMMWSDIALNHPEKLSAIPKDTIMLTWTYVSDPDENKVKTLAEAGMKQIVCPGTSSWNRFIEEIDRSEGNITKLVEYGKKYGALGVLNTNWGDFGHICSFWCQLYGVVIGAEKGWNADAKLTKDFEMAASSLLYDADDVNMIDIIREMGQCERTCDWMYFTYWYSANTKEGRVTKLGEGADPEHNLGNVDRTLNNVKRLDKVIEKLQSLDSDDFRYGELITAARGIRIMNKVCLEILGVEGYTDKDALSAEIEEWLPVYCEQWLRDNKESQLRYVKEFMSTLPYKQYNKKGDEGETGAFDRQS